MPTPDDQVPLHGDALLEATKAAMVEFHERYYGRPPGHARAMLMEDDLLACVLGNVYTDVEKTLIEIQRAPLVQDARSAFQTAMEPRFRRAVERLSGRRVEHFVSNSHVGPDLEIELFFLAPRGEGPHPPDTHAT